MPFRVRPKARCREEFGVFVSYDWWTLRLFSAVIENRPLGLERPVDFNGDGESVFETFARLVFDDLRASIPATEVESVSLLGNEILWQPHERHDDSYGLANIQIEEVA